MTVAISISKESNDIWTTKNENFRSLIARLREMHPNEAVVVQHLTMAGFFGGISLDTEMTESPELTERIVRLLLETAIDLEEAIKYKDASGDHPSLSDLIEILERFKKHHS